MLSNELGDIIEKKEAVIKQLTNTEELSKVDDDFENFGDLTGIVSAIPCIAPWQKTLRVNLDRICKPYVIWVYV